MLAKVKNAARQDWYIWNWHCQIQKVSDISVYGSILSLLTERSSFTAGGSANLKILICMHSKHTLVRSNELHLAPAPNGPCALIFCLPLNINT